VAPDHRSFPEQPRTGKSQEETIMKELLSKAVSGTDLTTAEV